MRLPQIPSLLNFIPKKLTLLAPLGVLVITILVVGGAYVYKNTSSKDSEILTLNSKIASLQKDIDEFYKQDQVVINKKLTEEIKNINETFKKAVVVYEKILDLKSKNQKTTEQDKELAQVLTLLANKDYSSASAKLTNIENKLKEVEEKAAASFKIPENIQTNNAPPSSGYSRQRVDSDAGSFLVDIISADLNSTKVIVDTASDSDCRDSCPVLSLGEYVSRSGAFAGVNGSYFCPAEYPSCAGKTNSYDTLAMNKNKVYFNSDNNVFSTVPTVIFSPGSARFVGQSLEWGRDTGVDAVLANQPLLLAGGNITFGGGSDPKQGSKGSRSFVGTKGNTVYIGVVHNATVAEVARVLKALAFDNALNLDSGGSTALWSGGYKVGPGRNIPNALLFIRK